MMHTLLVREEETLDAAGASTVTAHGVGVGVVSANTTQGFPFSNESPESRVSVIAKAKPWSLEQVSCCVAAVRSGFFEPRLVVKTTWPFT